MVFRRKLLDVDLFFRHVLEGKRERRLPGILFARREISIPEFTVAEPYSIFLSWHWVATELELWQAGIRSWEDFEDFFTRPASINRALRRRLEVYVPQSIEAINRKDAAFFSRLSNFGQGWRLFPEFSDQCVFLDIETTGLSSIFDTVTLVGLYDGHAYEVFVEGQNLQELPGRLRKYSLVVTFNGSGFDLRFLKLAFPGLVLPPIHVDLR